jgi:phosphatidylglycerol:prolipoprotein diacylglycerol transferase
MDDVLAAIPYKTFPTIALGPLHLRTFGLMVGLGVLLGAWVAGSYGERFGVPRDDTYRVATRMVIAGVIGARITWDITHWDQIHGVVDLIAVWKGGLQFSGGFIAAVIVGFPTFRKWNRVQRWRQLDGYAMGLTLGLAIGRIGCTSVGEHFGSRTNFFLATRFEGGSLREPTLYQHALADKAVHGHHVPIDVVKGMTFHNTAIYELIFLLVLFAGLQLVVRRKRPPAPGTAIGIFCLYYAIARGGTDFLRVNDKLVLGLTGAQWMCIALIPISAWILLRVRPATAALDAAGVAAANEPEPVIEEVETDSPTADTADAPPHKSEDPDAEVDPQPEPSASDP